MVYERAREREGGGELTDHKSVKMQCLHLKQLNILVAVCIASYTFWSTVIQQNKNQLDAFQTVRLHQLPTCRRKRQLQTWKSITCLRCTFFAHEKPLCRGESKLTHCSQWCSCLLYPLHYIGASAHFQKRKKNCAWWKIMLHISSEVCSISLAGQIQQNSHHLWNASRLTDKNLG